MEFAIGAILALVTLVAARAIGFDRSRSFYPVVLIIIATYYCLFAVMGGSITALWLDSAVAALFAVAAVIGFRTSLWLVVVGIAGHGVMDLFHSHIVDNAGVPAWWPGFCSAYDLAAALILAVGILSRGEPREPSLPSAR